MKAFIFTFLGLFSAVLFAQEKFSQIDELSDLEVRGTSSLHDWEIDGKKLSGNCEVEFNGTKITAVKNLTFSVEVGSLESGKSGMDKNTQNALKYGEHKFIKYKLNSISSYAPSKDGKHILMNSNGSLTIAGVTKTIDMKVAGRKLDNGNVIFLGKTEFKMTEYQVDPPTAMMGTIKTGDEIEVEFKIIYRN